MITRDGAGGQSQEYRPRGAWEGKQPRSPGLSSWYVIGQASMSRHRDPPTEFVPVLGRKTGEREREKRSRERELGGNEDWWREAVGPLCQERIKPLLGCRREQGQSQERLSCLLLVQSWMTTMRIHTACTPVNTPNSPLSLFGLPEFIANLCRVGYPLILGQQSKRVKHALKFGDAYFVGKNKFFSKVNKRDELTTFRKVDKEISNIPLCKRFE